MITGHRLQRFALADVPADLINVALEELVRAQCELPGYTTLDELTKKIRTEVNRGFFTLVSGRVDAAARARPARLLEVDPVTRRSEYDGLKDVAQAAFAGQVQAPPGVIYSTACDITDAANSIAAECRPVNPDNLATISPYITHVIRRFGNGILDLTPPAAAPTMQLELESRVVFAP